MSEIIFLDTETTSADAETMRIIQLAYRLHPFEAVSGIYRPPADVKIETGAMATHHITPKMLDGKPLFESDKQKIQEKIKGNILVAHNAPFDIAALKNEGIECGQFIDTLKVAMQLHDLEAYNLQYLRYHFGLYQIDGANPHDALGDIIVLEEVFKKLMNAVPDHNDSAQWMIDVSLKPKKMYRMPFGKHRGVLFENIPLDYLKWIVAQKDIDEDVKHNAKYHLGDNEQLNI